MRIGRTILSLLIALSLAVVPAAGAAAFSKDIDKANQGTELVATPEHDCCPHEGMPTDAMKQCQAAAGCFAKCVGFNAVMIFGATLRPPQGGIERAYANMSFRTTPENTPFRPPRG